LLYIAFARLVSISSNFLSTSSTRPTDGIAVYVIKTHQFTGISISKLFKALSR